MGNWELRNNGDWGDGGLGREWIDLVEAFGGEGGQEWIDLVEAL